MAFLLLHDEGDIDDIVGCGCNGDGGCVSAKAIVDPIGDGNADDGCKDEVADGSGRISCTKPLRIKSGLVWNDSQLSFPALHDSASSEKHFRLCSSSADKSRFSSPISRTRFSSPMSGSWLGIFLTNTFSAI